MRRAPFLVRLLVLTSVLLALLALIAQIPFFKTLQRPLNAVVLSVFKRFSSGGSVLWQALRSPYTVANYLKERDVLVQQIRKLTQENARFLELAQENLTLRRELNFFEEERYPLTVGRVAGRIREGGVTFLVINRGEKHGVAPGAPTLSDGMLVGKIVKTLGETSVVIPLTAPSVKTAATFAGGTKTAGIVDGELNVNLVMRFIPKDITVSEGTPVITSGLEEKIPRGLLIGTVKRVEADPQALFQTAYLASPLDFDAVSLISVIRAGAETF